MVVLSELAVHGASPRQAEPMPGPTQRAFQELAARHGIWLINGSAHERASEGVYNTCAVIDPRGAVVARYRKMFPFRPYATILTGAHPIYLDGYALSDLSMYGGIPLAALKAKLLAIKKAGQLSRVRVVLLTNITFDGITYDPYRIMHDVLAIHPDVAFVWDEAWFAYGRSSPLLRGRSAMEAARRLDDHLRSPEAIAACKAWRPPTSDQEWLEAPLVPDPSQARVRVYATRSTHKGAPTGGGEHRSGARAPRADPVRHQPEPVLSRARPRGHDPRRLPPLGARPLHSGGREPGRARGLLAH